MIILWEQKTNSKYKIVSSAICRANSADFNSLNSIVFPSKLKERKINRVKYKFCRKSYKAFGVF